MQEARDLIKFLQWGHSSVSKRFLDAAIRFLLDTPSQNLNALAAVRVPCASCAKGICLAPARPWRDFALGPDLCQQALPGRGRPLTARTSSLGRGAYRQEEPVLNEICEACAHLRPGSSCSWPTDLSANACRMRPCWESCLLSVSRGCKACHGEL